jgi:predicted kinase
MTAAALRIVLGTAGSGKSTVAQRLAREHAATYLDKDAMSARFVEAALLAAGYDPGDRESNLFYRDRILPLEYDSLLDVAGDNLRIGRPVVIDAPFSPYLADPDFIGTSARRFNWPAGDVEVIQVRVTPETLQQRLRDRGLPRDQVKLARWDEYWAEHGNRACAWTGVRHIELSNDENEPLNLFSPGFHQGQLTAEPVSAAIMSVSAGQKGNR